MDQNPGILRIKKKKNPGIFWSVLFHFEREREKMGLLFLFGQSVVERLLRVWRWIPTFWVFVIDCGWIQKVRMGSFYLSLSLIKLSKITNTNSKDRLAGIHARKIAFGSISGPKKI